MLWELGKNDASVVKVPLSTLIPSQPVVPVLNRRELNLNQSAVPYVRTSVPKQEYLSGNPCFPTRATERMVSRLTTSIDSIETLSSLPPFGCNQVLW